MTNKFILLVVGAAWSIYGTGCTYTWVSVHQNYPHISDTNNFIYRLSVKVDGAYGYAYDDETPKTIHVVLADHNCRRLFRQVYHINGAQVKWDLIWNEPNIVTVEFFDYGVQMIFEEHAKKAGVPMQKRALLTIKLKYDETTHRFEEIQKVLHYKGSRHIQRCQIIWCDGAWYFDEIVKYPPGCTFENEQYRLYFEQDTDNWKMAPSLQTIPRTIRLGIWDYSRKWEWVGAGGDKKGCKLRREYHVVASQMDWQVSWETLENLEIQIFDYGDGISSKKGKECKLPRNPVLFLRYSYDPQEDEFVEKEIKRYR